MSSFLLLRHIQEANSNSTLEPHWGYPSRVLPCTNDAGSCEYLDGVYWMHDISMLYSFILWAVIGSILAIAVTIRAIKPSRSLPRRRSLGTEQSESSSSYYRAWRAIRSTIKRRLLPESGSFGHVTRLQIFVLAILLGYLLIFSLVGIVYKTWTTPIKNSTLLNTRTGLGGFSDRVGALAYALTPLTVALATRESILSLASGIPYQSFTFLHRWLGRIIFVQAFLHTLGWTLIEGKLYQPQPKVYMDFIKQPYMIWGCIAMLFITFLYIFSMRRVIKWTGHEFFRKTHYVVAALYIGACWGHWSKLACWMIASLGIWAIDRGLRLLRTLLIHTGYLDRTRGFGFYPAQASVNYFGDEDGGVVRLDFDHNHDSWKVGQHYFLCFPTLTIWQSHPMTVAAVPAPHPAMPHHTYIVRCRKGETGRLRTLALSGCSKVGSKEAGIRAEVTTPIILSGPYGSNLLPRGEEVTNIMAIAGGTGISLLLPVVVAATSDYSFLGAAIDLIWLVRRSANIGWISAELEDLRRQGNQKTTNLNIHIYVTQEHDPTSTPTGEKTSEIGIEPLSGSGSLSSASEELVKSPNHTINYLKSCHPSLGKIVTNFIESRASFEYRTRVIASGPASMGQDLRAAVARSNDGGKVWKGEKKWDVDLHWDDRM